MSVARMAWRRGRIEERQWVRADVKALNVAHADDAEKNCNDRGSLREPTRSSASPRAQTKFFDNTRSG